MRSLKNRICDPPCYYIKGEKGDPGCKGNFATLQYGRFLNPHPDASQDQNNMGFTWVGSSLIKNPYYQNSQSPYYNFAYLKNPLSTSSNFSQFNVAPNLTLDNLIKNLHPSPNNGQSNYGLQLLQFLHSSSASGNNDVTLPDINNNKKVFSKDQPFQRSPAFIFAPKNGIITGYSVNYSHFYNKGWTDKTSGSTLPHVPIFCGVGNVSSNSPISWTLSGQSASVGSYNSHYEDVNYSGHTINNPEWDIQEFDNSTNNFQSNSTKGNRLPFKKGDILIMGLGPSINMDKNDLIPKLNTSSNTVSDGCFFGGSVRYASGECNMHLQVQFYDD